MKLVELPARGKLEYGSPTRTVAAKIVAAVVGRTVEIALSINQ